MYRIQFQKLFKEKLYWLRGVGDWGLKENSMSGTACKIFSCETTNNFQFTLNFTTYFRPMLTN